MTKDLPDEWFRPERPVDDDATVPISRVPGAASGATAGSAASTSGSATSAQSGTSASVQSAWSASSHHSAQSAPSASSWGSFNVPPQVHRPTGIPVVATQEQMAAESWRQRPGPVAQPSWASRHPGLLTLLVLLLALAVGISTGVLYTRQRHQRTEPPVTAPVTTAATPTTQQPSSPQQQKPWDGATQVLKASAVSATCTAPSAKDEAGKTVTYDAKHVLDNDPATAWRCAGDGVGQSLSFTFPEGSELVGVGMVNGYKKESSNGSLYPEYRRITSVRWTMADGSYFVQTLSENDQGVQQVLTPPIPLRGPVKLTIEASTAPGVGSESRDAVLVSTVVFYQKG